MSYLKTAGCVAALSTIAEEVVDSALVDVGTLFTGGIHLVTGITNTPVCSQHILTSTVRTHVRILGAFVNIWNKKWMMLSSTWMQWIENNEIRSRYHLRCGFSPIRKDRAARIPANRVEDMPGTVCPNPWVVRGLPCNSSNSIWWPVMSTGLNTGRRGSGRSRRLFLNLLKSARKV